MNNPFAVGAAIIIGIILVMVFVFAFAFDRSPAVAAAPPYTLSNYPYPNPTTPAYVLNPPYYLEYRLGPRIIVPRPRPTPQPSPQPTSTQPVYCTMDAKMCPDGSYVGRVAPTCQFAACPGASGI